MRPVLLILVCALVAVPAALAAPRATGDGVLQLQSVYGKVSIGTVQQPARGTLWGQIDTGTIQTTDPVMGDGLILVNGWDTKTLVSSDQNGKVYLYKGSNMHFRVTGGKYKVAFSGTNINLTAVGAGVAYMYGSPNVFDPGSYEVDSNDWQPVPLSNDSSSSHRVPFGTQPPTSTTSGP
jgi:hypothetical protein